MNSRDRQPLVIIAVYCGWRLFEPRLPAARAGRTAELGAIASRPLGYRWHTTEGCRHLPQGNEQFALVSVLKNAVQECGCIAGVFAKDLSHCLVMWGLHFSPGAVKRMAIRVMRKASAMCVDQST